MRNAILGTAAALALVATLPALAQKAPDAPAATKLVVIPKGVFYRGLGPTQYLAKARLIGQPVVDKSGAKVGDIEDVILVSKDNQIDGVILGVGGFLGVGEKKIGVRYSALKLETKDGKTVISMPAATKELLGAVDAYGGQRTLGEKASDAMKKAEDAVKNVAKKASDAVSAKK